MNAKLEADQVKFKQEYKKALKEQNKTFNQNGKHCCIRGQKAKQSFFAERNIDLNRENAILLSKLVDISQGKWSSVHGPSTLKAKKSSNSVGPRSLNISIRRRENRRIERENHAFAKRLY